MAVITQQAKQYDIRPVPAGERTLGLWDSFVLWADLGISFLVMVVGTFLVPGLSLGRALAAIVIGALLGNFLLALIAMIGTDTGVPTMVLLRPVLGLRGSFLPTALNVAQLLGWATFEVIVMAQAADTLAQRLLGTSSYLAWVVFFTAVTTLMAVGGPVLVVKQWMKRFAVWAVLVTTVWLTVAVAATYDLGELIRRPGTGDLSFPLAVDLVVALPVSWVPLVADYSRFARRRAEAFWGTGLGYLVPHIWFYVLGALFTLGAGVAFDPNAPIAPLLAAVTGLTAGWAALLIILVDEADEAFANIYSTAVSAQNVLTRVSQRTLAAVTGAVVLVAASVIPLVQYESFLLLIGSIFVPLIGVLAADYFVLRNQRYDLDQLYRPGGVYWYRGGINWRAIGVWVMG
ncbi:MAG: putative hydroxymethylpyrimidine transporter CytX, partial [Acidimicrobiia bacterium]